MDHKHDDMDEGRFEGILVDIDSQKGTITVEVDGDFFVCLWPSDFEGEVGDSIEVTMDDVLNG